MNTTYKRVCQSDGTPINVRDIKITTQKYWSRLMEILLKESCVIFEELDLVNQEDDKKHHINKSLYQQKVGSNFGLFQILPST